MFNSLRKAFLAGIVLLAPLGITLFVFNWLVIRIGGSFKGKVLFFIPTELINQQNLEMFWNVTATFMVLILITLLGFLSRYFVAKYLWTLGEKFLNRLPLINTVYKSVKQIVDTFSSQKKAVFEKVVLIEFPRKGCKALGFYTGMTKGEAQARTEAELWNIFVPTTPNPTSGFLVMLPRSEIKVLDMTVGDGMKLIISGGAVAPNWVNQSELKEQQAQELG
ncbi:DUF502 domain-containing protein [Puniceicoccaceae bacterium K14]|nr:DUF502 domain-containing protein [Puniceicoccaceae bacterium K14]